VAIRENAAPLEGKLTTIAGALSALHGEFRQVDEHLSATAEALGD